MPSPLHASFCLDPTITFLNHGSFGACPRAVLDAQAQFRARMEAEPVRFFIRELEGLLDGVRRELAAFVGADAGGIAFVPNATTAVNNVVASLAFQAGDQILTTNHAYNACRNAIDAAAARFGAEVVVARFPFPLASSDEVVDAVVAAVTPRTRLALIDHVTSPTGLVLPVERLVQELDARGVDTIVDGAHAPGMVALDLRELGAAYYTGNLHKWVCAPKGAAFLHVRADKRDAVRPAVVSHGRNSTRTDRSRYLLEFDWTGTSDPSAILSVPTAIQTVAALVPGGWQTVRNANRALALRARDLLLDAVGTPKPAPDSMIGSLAAVLLPNATGAQPSAPLFLDPLQDELFERFRIEVPIVPWGWPKRLVRIAAQLYNDEADYALLAEALRSTLTSRAGSG